MKLGPILRAELPDEKRAVVETECYFFLLAGGTITLADWDGFSSDGRHSMISAAQQVAKTRARVVADQSLHASAEALAHARETEAMKDALAVGEAEAAKL